MASFGKTAQYLSPAYAAYRHRDKLFGSSKGQPGVPEGYESFSTLNPEQTQLWQMISSILTGQGGQLEGPLGEYQKMISGGPEATAAFEAPLMRQFNEQIVPGLAERFSGAGAGAQSSSAFQQALGGAGADLTERLGALRGGMKMQGLQSFMQLLQSILGQNTMGLVEKQKPWWQEALTNLAPAAARAAVAGATGGFG